jgi:hypothetical protein
VHNNGSHAGQQKQIDKQTKAHAKVHKVHTWEMQTRQDTPRNKRKHTEKHCGEHAE